MSKTLELGVPDDVPITVNVNRLEGNGPKLGYWLIIHSSDVDLYLTNDDAAVTGETAVPATNKRAIAAADLPAQYRIRGGGRWGLVRQGGSDGTAVVECTS